MLLFLGILYMVSFILGGSNLVTVMIGGEAGVWCGEEVTTGISTACCISFFFLPFILLWEHACQTVAMTAVCSSVSDTTRLSTLPRGREAC